MAKTVSLRVHYSRLLNICTSVEKGYSGREMGLFPDLRSLFSRTQSYVESDPLVE